NPPKTIVGVLARKTLALALAYAFFATSLWSQVGPGVRTGSRGGSPLLINLLRRLTDPRMRALASATASPASSFTPAAPVAPASPAPDPPVSNNPAGFNASALFDDGHVPQNCSVHNAKPHDDDDDGEDSHRHYGYDNDDPPRPPAQAIDASGFKIFGPQTYVRTYGDPNHFTSSFTVPAWLTGPFYMHVENGDTRKNHRSELGAVIGVNGSIVLNPSDFDDPSGSIDCLLGNLTANSTLTVTLTGKKGSFVIVTILG